MDSPQSLASSQNRQEPPSPDDCNLPVLFLKYLLSARLALRRIRRTP